MQTVQLGYTLMNALFFDVREGLEDYNEAAQILGCTDIRRDGSVHELPMKDLRSPEVKRRIETLSTEQLTAYMVSMATVHHEMQHIRQAFSSPTGLHLTISAVTMLRILQESLWKLAANGCKVIRMPILGCCDSQANEHEDAGVVALANWLRTNHLLLGTMLGTRVVKMRELLEERARLKKVNDRQPTVLSGLSDDAPSSPAGLTISHLLEGESRFEDVKVLSLWSEAGAPEHIVDVILGRFLGVPGYHEAWNYFKRNAPSVPDGYFLVALHLSLWTHGLGLSAGIQKLSEEQKWEDIQPLWRFARVVEWLSKNSVPDDFLARFREMVIEICGELKWPSTLDMAQAHLAWAADSSIDPFRRDLIERHKAYCRRLLSCGLGMPSSWAEELEFQQRCRPWMRADGRYLHMQEVPPWINDQQALQLVLHQTILQDVQFESSFAKSRRVWDQVMRRAIEDGRITRMTADDYFVEGVHMVTGYHIEQILQA